MAYLAPSEFVPKMVDAGEAMIHMAPAIKARIKVSLVAMKILDSPASTIFDANSAGWI